MMEMTIVKALLALGFDSGWIANENGIIFWDNEKPQPTEKELETAGWVKLKDETPSPD
jgi:hypothetical protein